MAAFSYSDKMVVKIPITLLLNVLMCSQLSQKVPDVQLGGDGALDP